MNWKTSNALLAQAPRTLETGGRIAVISFHSMEDRLVKQAFRSAEQTGQLQDRHQKAPLSHRRRNPPNPRSRSAKLRVLEKVASH